MLHAQKRLAGIWSGSDWNYNMLNWDVKLFSIHLGSQLTPSKERQIIHARCKTTGGYDAHVRLFKSWPWPSSLFSSIQ